jgi:hypothetical protein
MAKSKSGFVLSQAIRDELKRSPKASGKEVIEAIKKAHPGTKFNESTASVTWSKLRRDLGLSKGRKRARRAPRQVATVARRTEANGDSTAKGVIAQVEAVHALIGLTGSPEGAKRLIDAVVG